MISLVGSTGFVGSNIAAGGTVDRLYHSTDVGEAFGTRPDVLIYAGLRAEKFLAEKFPEKDLESIRTAENNITQIAPEKLVLISTIDVYEDPFHATENVPAKGCGYYGKHRAMLEEWVRQQYPDALIIRLPGLFGKGIRKNFIYDYIHYIPFLLNETKYAQLLSDEPRLETFYFRNEKGFYQCRELAAEERGQLREMFEKLGFSALNFTDSRGLFQYYFLSHLYDDIFTAMDNNIKVLNITTEPVRISEIYSYLTGGEFVNEIAPAPPCYDVRTIWYEAFGGFAADGQETENREKGGYLYSREQVLKEIRRFVEEEITL